MSDSAFPPPFPDLDSLISRRRHRRTRRFPWLRDLVRETELRARDLILPLFLIEGENRAEPIDAMPGVSRLTIDRALKKAAEAEALGIPAIALFANPPLESRDATGSGALDPENLVCRFLRRAKPNLRLGLIADPALDPFTDHGHDGVMRGGEIANDESVSQIAKAALVQAETGADVIAPSDMMDGRIAAIRKTLDEAGYGQTAIISYATKFASAFYGPYRQAVSTDQTLKGDKATYYLDPANAREAESEAASDLQQGADILLVKPALPYLDIIRRLRVRFDAPIFAYQVSGEYAMIEAAAKGGHLDGDRILMESLLAIKRAGASAIFTYHAVRAAKLLARQN